MELTTHIPASRKSSSLADLPELPCFFASSNTLDELFESLQEGVALFPADEGEQGGPLDVATASRRIAPRRTVG